MPEDSIKNLEKKLKKLKAKPNKGTSGRKKVGILNQLASAYRHSDPRKTEDYAHQALVLAEKLHSKKDIANSHQMIGVSSEIRGDYNNALQYFLKSLRIFEQIGNKQGIANSHIHIGIVHDKQSDYEQALAHCLKALNIKEETGDKQGIAICCDNLAIICFKQGDYGQALEYYLKALNMKKEAIDVDKKGIANSYCNIGIIFAEQNNEKQALEYLLKSLHIREEIGDKNGIANSYHNIANIHRRQGNYKQALEYLHKCLEISEQLGDKEAIAASCNNIGSVLTQFKDYDSALRYLQKGLLQAQEIGARHFEIENYQYSCELYEVQQDYKKSLYYHKKYTNLEKEVFNKEKSKQITEMKTKYETEKREKEAEIFRIKSVELSKEIKQRRKVEKELKKHRNHLEELVEKRTAELKATNVELEKEIAQRISAEKELINYQRQLKSLAHELSLVEERERRKIATNLHDNISQSLAIIKFKLGTMHATASNPQMKVNLKELRTLMHKVIQRTRSMTFEISPPVLYELGFEPAVEWLTGQFRKQYGVACEFESDDSPKPMSHDTRVILFQSVRELLANVRKHAKAHKVNISAMREGNVVRIAVEDDGIGFDPRDLTQKITKNEGFGLFNLRERLGHLRGNIEIDSRQGHGTSITLIAPLKRSRKTTKRKRT